ncbi:MAG: GNAT family N-acetyltransferase [Chloroflexota bacterium]|nr:GNAT family N-acetyltransferase [Chloroflexota bacterium]
MTSSYWPLFGLRLRTPRLELRPLTEPDLEPLAALLPDDVELNPEAPAYDVRDLHVARGIVVHQEYWRSYGTWRVEAWRLNFAVFADARLIGTQELEGNDFPLLRTVDTSSWLAADARGRGYGKEMRRAVLACAFGPMSAIAAVTSAWHDNHGSLGVSRALGYLANGETLHRRGDGVDVMVHLRLRREGWMATEGAADIAIDGFDSCRHLFGLSSDDERLR